MSADLKSCPFCGEKPEISGGKGSYPWVVDCCNPHCVVVASVDGTDTQAIAAWNRRAPVSADLSDPVAVHANMLRGTIAKPTPEQIKHLYPDLFAPVSAGKVKALGPNLDGLIDLIGELGREVYYLLDDCETSGPVGEEVHTITREGLEKVSGILDRIDELPFEEPGCILGTGAMLQAAFKQTISAHQPGDGWQDISSAPKDGTWFLAFIAELGLGSIRYVHFADAYDRFPINADSRCWSRAPTHWAPLPASLTWETQG